MNDLPARVENITDIRRVKTWAMIQSSTGGMTLIRSNIFLLETSIGIIVFKDIENYKKAKEIYDKVMDCTG